MNWEEFLKWKRNHGISFQGLTTPFSSDSIKSYSGKDDMFLNYCQECRPKLYEELKKGAC